METKSKRHKNKLILNHCYVLLICVCFNVQRVCLCTGHFVIVPLNLTCPHCLQHFVLNISCILHNMTRVFKTKEYRTALTCTKDISPFK